MRKPSFSKIECFRTRIRIPNSIRFSLFTFNALSDIFLIMATNSSKQQHIDKSYKIKYNALKELEKRTPHKDVARMFEVTKNTLSTR